MISVERTAGKLDVVLLHLPHSKRSVVERLIEKYKPKRNVYCAIEMKNVPTDETPVFQHARRFAYTEQKVVGKHVEEWLD